MNKPKIINVYFKEEDYTLIREITKLYKISVAEWMRRIALREAERDRNLIEKKLEPEEALAAISRMNLPVGPARTMTRESLLGRLEE
jgi:hypothetical protein